MGTIVMSAAGKAVVVPAEFACGKLPRQMTSVV